ncbi:hypothetical protein, partial [Cyclobacterium qasimii]|uniref:hypothetical protein n=1 Tax=Cyclobacterium qasimii TaxID=1350429 RepID=UPI001C3F9AE2
FFILDHLKDLENISLRLRDSACNVKTFFIFLILAKALRRKVHRDDSLLIHYPLISFIILNHLKDLEKTFLCDSAALRAVFNSSI